MKSRETEVERRHGHCADLLMSDFDVDRSYREALCKEIDLVWAQVTLIHCMIVLSVRGYAPDPATRGIEDFLREHGTEQSRFYKDVVMGPGRD